jgi:hypothetical protein
MSHKHVLTVLLVALVACDGNGGGSNNDGGGNGDPDGGATADAPEPIADGSVVVGGDAGPWVCNITTCDNHLTECGDCIDNDGDGETDSMDPECLGPCDNTEGPGLNGGVGGETGGPCKADCYFDFGNGPGNDDCHWDHRCDPLAVPPNYPPEGMSCEFEPARVGGTDCPATQSTLCHDTCAPLTPNGCDCFGCCEFPELAGMGPGGGQGYVWLGNLDGNGNGLCTFADILDPAACPPCTPVADCLNDCLPCEVCIGAPPPGPECFDGDAGTTLQCPGGEVPCGLPGQASCAAGSYCVSGCCQDQIG